MEAEQPLPERGPALQASITIQIMLPPPPDKLGKTPIGPTLYSLRLLMCEQTHMESQAICDLFCTVCALCAIASPAGPRHSAWWPGYLDFMFLVKKCRGFLLISRVL
jgi:hypothetical protein